MRALVLAGGGSKGSWQAGVLKALAHHPEYHSGFHYVAGTSVGALNAAAVAMNTKHDFPESIHLLEEIWHSKLNIWKLKFPPYISGLWSNSLGTNKGLKDLLNVYIDCEQIGRSNVTLNITAVSLQSGKVRRFSGKDPLLLDGLLASSCFPIAFPPQNIEGELYTDGGVRDVAPLSPAIKSGATEIVVVLCSDPNALEHSPLSTDRLNRVYKVAMQVVEIMAAEVLMNDIKKCNAMNAEIEDGGAPGKRRIKLHLYFPQRPLGDSLNFNANLMRSQFAMGYADGMAKLRELD